MRDGRTWGHTTDSLLHLYQCPETGSGLEKGQPFILTVGRAQCSVGSRKAVDGAGERLLLWAQTLACSTYAVACGGSQV